MVMVLSSIPSIEAGEMCFFPSKMKYSYISSVKQKRSLSTQMSLKAFSSDLEYTLPVGFEGVLMMMALVLLGYALLNGVSIELPFGWRSEERCDWLGTDHLDREAVILIVRRRDDDLVPGVQECQAGRVHRSGRAFRADEVLLRIRFQSIERFHLLGDGLSEDRQPVESSIGVPAVIDRFLGRRPRPKVECPGRKRLGPGLFP